MTNLGMNVWTQIHFKLTLPSHSKHGLTCFVAKRMNSAHLSSLMLIKDKETVYL